VSRGASTLPTEGACKAAAEITRYYGATLDANKLAELIDQSTLGLGRTALVSPMPDGDIKIDYRACGKVVDTKFYSQQDFAKLGRIAFSMGAFVTP
jgi:hypothetical protein